MKYTRANSYLLNESCRYIILQLKTYMSVNMKFCGPRKGEIGRGRSPSYIIVIDFHISIYWNNNILQRFLVNLSITVLKVLYYNKTLSKIMEAPRTFF